MYTTSLVIKDWKDLSIDELHAIYQLRQEIFIVEQDCPYLDTDDKDKLSIHVSMYEDKVLIAYARILPPRVSYKHYSSIGRVVTKEYARRRGLSRSLMKKSIELAQHTYPGVPIKISAQTYIMGFYESLGFKAIGEEYLEDDLPHQAMILE